tara:strand:- start:4696 stop:5100 length:405 start_codon:yes stop_codon:yes gene_type:complete
MAINDGRVVSNFIVQALSGKEITIYGDGKQTRSLCYVDDLVSGLVTLMNTPKIHQPVNLGNPNELSIKQIAEKIIELSDSKSKLINKPLPEDDPKQRCPDISRANELLGWQPVTKLDAGLKSTIAYFKEKISEN